MKNYRYWYIAYIVFAIIIYFCLSKKLSIADTDVSGKISLIASISELLGLSIALTEIFVINNLYTEIKNKFQNLFTFRESIDSINLISSVLQDISNNKYSIAIYKLETIRDSYQGLFPVEIIEDTLSEERRNIDKLNNIITKITLKESQSGKLKKELEKNYIDFLLKLNINFNNISNNLKEELL
ncbi:hypothetical protein [Flavobacterium suncheonense]|uniref:Uncharacterized protein n=1 Tax=Flavobacterium suncheonense GH29-5 = DSM 17707 TaxID=1121899 RepID=A0A0A2M199_9FLAO|nr:hypothetical protein [Flavobacterium suncheonense]KGO85208.1 hypothetical protein Q764_14200 [Flavobacterium suncheonense GH29-5 = DSM 17707]